MTGAIIGIVAVAISVATLYFSQKNNSNTRKDTAKTLNLAASSEWVDQLEKRVALCESDRLSLRHTIERMEVEAAEMRKENRELLLQLVRRQSDSSPHHHG